MFDLKMRLVLGRFLPKMVREPVRPVDLFERQVFQLRLMIRVARNTAEVFAPCPIVHFLISISSLLTHIKCTQSQVSPLLVRACSNRRNKADIFRPGQAVWSFTGAKTKERT